MHQGTLSPCSLALGNHMPSHVLWKDFIRKKNNIQNKIYNMYLKYNKDKLLHAQKLLNFFCSIKGKFSNFQTLILYFRNNSQEQEPHCC